MTEFFLMYFEGQDYYALRNETIVGVDGIITQENREEDQLYVSQRKTYKSMPTARMCPGETDEKRSSGNAIFLP